jgi:hypothetical protein
MRELPEKALTDLRRRRFLLGSAAAAAAVGLTGAGVAPADQSEEQLPRGPVPKPIPGGEPIGLPAPYDFIHVHTPGPVGITTPFNKIPLEGLNVEPATLTNFSGTTAQAYLVGSAMGSDGVEYNMETDLRIYEGQYRVNGKKHRGLFAFV